MVANETSLLLPRHNDLDPENQKDTSRTTRETQKIRRLRKEHPAIFWGTCVIFGTLSVIIGIAVAWNTLDPSLSSSPSSSSRNTSHSLESGLSAIDAKMDVWEEWRRKDVVQDKKSMTDNHLQTTQKIIDWESLQTNMQNSWQRAQKYADEQVVSAEQRESSMGDGLHQALQQSTDELGSRPIDHSSQTGPSNTLLLSQVENESWWANQSTGFQKTWTEFSEEAHDVWADLSTRARTAERTLWNQTLHNEQEWYSNSITNMRKLGVNLRGWWSSASENLAKDEMIVQGEIEHFWNLTKQEEGELWDQASNKERVLNENFVMWWNSTAEHERRWWAQTRDAFRAFSNHALETEKLWWRMVRHTSDHFWNETRDGVANFASTAQNEARDSFDRTRNATISDITATWNTTVQTEQKMWKAIQKWFNAHASYADELSQPLLYLNSTQAFGMITNGYGWFDYSKDFFLMQGGLDAQINQAYCAVASSAALLNSVRSDVNLPVDPIYIPYHYATQKGLLNNSCANDNVVRFNSTFDGIWNPPYGLSLVGTRRLLECHLPNDQFNVQMYQLDPEKIDLDQFRLDLSEALRDPNSRVIINYDRKGLGQIGGGHFSPLGSYHQIEDRFLVMDVAKYKYPAVWVPAAKLYSAMATIDRCGISNLPQGQDSLPHVSQMDEATYLKLLLKLDCKPTYRGYVIVRKRGHAPPTPAPIASFTSAPVVAANGTSQPTT